MVKFVDNLHPADPTNYLFNKQNLFLNVELYFEEGKKLQLVNLDDVYCKNHQIKKCILVY